MAEKPELEAYEVNLTEYDQVIFGFPVWASNFTPPIRTFIEENKEALKGKKFAAFACQSGGGAEIVLAKLAKSIGIDAFERTVILIDPKAKKNESTDAQIDSFCESL